MADRAVVMSRGHIEQLGTPLENYDRPATRFVARFFGTPTMNVDEGAIASNGTASGSASPAWHPPQTGDLNGSRIGRKIALGVRPERVPIGGAGTVGGTALLLEPLGDVTLAHFETEDGSSLVAKVVASTPLVPGARQRFGLDAERCHVFDAGSGARLN